MSYILDALRKSEAQRRLGQSPDLNTVAALPSPRRSRSPRRPLVVWLLSVLVVIAMVALWLGGPLQVWLAGHERSSESVSVPDDPDSTVPSADGLAATDPSTEPEVVATAPETATDPSGQEPVIVDRRSPAQRPVTVVSRPAPLRALDVPRTPVERERLVETPEEAQRLIEAAQMAARRSSAPSVPATTPSTEAAEPGQADPGPWAPERNDYLRQWELPLAIRRDLPELSLSIHVFSTEPRGRFVLINGERRLEGDELGQGARLVEIRREGALVEFRDYRFLLEP